MAASLGPGSVSTLALSNRSTGLLLTIGPSALLIAGLPRLAKMAALRDWPNLQRTLHQMLLVSMGVASLLTAVLCIFSKPIVKFLFQGNNFTSADTLAVAHLQALLVLQLPFAVGSAVLARILVVLQLKKLLIYVSAASLLFSVILNWLFMKTYGLSGIAVATVVGQALILLVLIFLVSRCLRGFVQPNLLRMSDETFSKL
jgi:putative peptidoglycan lipid II flippase